MTAFFQLLSIVFLLGLSAIFSGLTVGLLSLNIFELKRKSQLKDPEAMLVYPLKARGSELLVTLTLCNVLINALVAIIIDQVTPGSTYLTGFIAAVITTVLITIFAEILPVAYFRRHGLHIGAKFAPYITIVMNIMRPISKPLGNLIDNTIGLESQNTYSAAELMLFLEEYQASEDSEVEADEMLIVKNALRFGDKFVRDVMTPITVVKAIEANEKFTLGNLKDLQDSGFSRFPVYEGDMNNIVGLLYLRDLISNNSQSLTAGSAAEKNVNYVNEKQFLDHVLNGFLKTKKHMFIVVNEFEETVGIITIEDIIEEIIGREIVDEFDKFDDLRQVARLKAQKRKRQRIGGRI